MGTQGPGRKRIPNREKLTAEDDALNQIAREAEARLAAKRAARAEAREIRMKELERQQKEMSDDEERMSVGSRGSFRVEERPDRDFLDKGSRTASTLSAATLASLGGASSRRGSCDTSFSVETEASIRDMKESLVEVEEKYRKAMVSNAQLHNEKTTLMYQVETLKEELSDMEELLWESRRHCDDTSRVLERERQAHSVLQFQFEEMKETLRQTEELLTKHGVVVSPEASTNGETAQGDDEDDVSAEPAAGLAREPPHGRESVLGKVGEQQPAQGNHTKNFWIYKRSRSLNAVSTNEHKPDNLKPARRSDKQARTEGARKTPRNYESEAELTNKRQTRQNGLFTGIKKQQMENEPGAVPQVCEPKSAVTRLMLDDRTSGRTEPHSESAASEQDVPGTDDQTRPIHMNTAGAHLVERGTESQVKRGDLVSPVPRAPTERVHKSRLVPPRPAKDIILDNRLMVSSIVAACRQTDPPPKKPNVVMGSQIPSSDEAAAGNCSPAAGGGVSCSDGRAGPVVPVRSENRINEFSSPTSVDSLKEKNCVDKMAEIDGEGWDGPSSQDENTENETAVRGKTSQSLLHHQRTGSETLEMTTSEDKALKDDGHLSCSGFETKQTQTEIDAFLPAAEETSGLLEKLEKWRIYDEESVREAAKIQDSFSQHLEGNNQTKTPESAFLPVEMSKHWNSLEKTTESRLRRCVDAPGPPNQWISDVKQRLKNAAENMSNQHDAVDQADQSTGQMTGITLTLKDFREGSETPELRAAARSALITDCLVSGMLEAASLGKLPQTDEVSTENTSAVVFSVREFKVDVTDSVDVEEEKQSQSDPTGTSCSEEFVFIETHFAEPAKTKMLESGSDSGLVDSLRNQVAEAVAKKTRQRETVPRSRLVPAEKVVEMQLKRHQTMRPTAQSHAGQSSKVRRLIEITADEIKAMAVPELMLMSLQEGGIVADQQINESAGLDTGGLEGLSVGGVDSCEEVCEEAAQQPAAQPVTEVVVEDVKVVPVVSSMKLLRGRKGISLDSRNHGQKTECKIS